PASQIRASSPTISSAWSASRPDNFAGPQESHKNAQVAPRTWTASPLGFSQDRGASRPSFAGGDEPSRGFLSLPTRSPQALYHSVCFIIHLERSRRDGNRRNPVERLGSAPGFGVRRQERRSSTGDDDGGATRQHCAVDDRRPRAHRTARLLREPFPV